MDSGITLDKSLSILVDLVEKPQAKEVLTEVHKRVHAGSSFADALAEFPKVFSKLYINMIRAGETGGTLASSLNNVASFLEKSEELNPKKKKRRAVDWREPPGAGVVDGK